MFKRFAAGIAILAVLLLVPGCSQSSSTGLTQKDFYLEIDGIQYRCDDNIQTVIASLGSKYTYSDGLSCAYDGLDKTYDYESASFFTNPLPSGDLVCEIYTENPVVVTSKGIAVGDSKDAVLAAHGDICEDTGNMLIYRVQ